MKLRGQTPINSNEFERVIEYVWNNIFTFLQRKGAILNLPWNFRLDDSARGSNSTPLNSSVIVLREAAS